jgi:hypothetical protein
MKCVCNIAQVAHALPCTFCINIDANFVSQQVSATILYIKSCAFTVFKHTFFNPPFKVGNLCVYNFSDCYPLVLIAG